jgi:hypothetical protein
MKRSPFVLIPLVLAVAGGAFGFVVQSRKIRQIERELDWVRKELRKSAPESPVAVIPLPDSGTPEGPLPSPTPLARMEPGTTPSGKSFDPVLITPETLETLQDVVKDQVKEEMANLKRKKGGNVSVKTLAKELELDSYAQERLTLFYNDCKDRGLELLSSPRSDGGNFMDDFAAAEVSGSGAKEVWGRLFSDRVPGTEQTYFQRLMEIGAETTRNIETLLTPEQIEDYGTYEIDPFKVDTGYDPFENYTRERNGR